MKVKVTTVEEVDIDIQFPCYRKDRYSVYRFDSEKSGINIYEDGTIIKMETSETVQKWISESKECSEEYFKVIAAKAKNYYSNLFARLIEHPAPMDFNQEVFESTTAGS